MSKRFSIAVNKTEVPTAVYNVLLNFALKVVYRDAPNHRRGPTYRITVNRCTRTLFMGRFAGFAGSKAFRLGFKEPSRCKSYASHLGETPFGTFNEMVVGIAAWMFAQDMLGDSRRTRAISHDAIVEAQQHAEALAAEVAEAEAREKSKEGQKFARVIFGNMERQSLEYRLKQLDNQEKVWQRKFKLATTKLKGLRRRRSALIAADKRKKAATI